MLSSAPKGARAALGLHNSNLEQGARSEVAVCAHSLESAEQGVAEVRCPETITFPHRPAPTCFFSILFTLYTESAFIDEETGLGRSVFCMVMVN